MASCDIESHILDTATYSLIGHPSGITFLPAVKQLLREKDLAFRCDEPTEALGNCFPYAIMQQLHRPEIQATLFHDMRMLSENYDNLRKSVVGFVKNINPTSEYFYLIDVSRTEYALTRDAMNTLEGAMNFPEWDKQLKNMSQNGKWFNDQFMQFTAWYLKRDIICYTNNASIKFCASSSDRTGSFRENVACNCSALPLYIANIRNTHFQSLIPIETRNENVQKNNQEPKNFQCDFCTKSYVQKKTLSLFLQHYSCFHYLYSY